MAEETTNPKEKSKKSSARKATSKTSEESTSEETSKKQSSYKRLYRSKTNAVIAGVAGGLAEYFVSDPVIIRILFVLSTFFGGFGLPVYIILWVILPEKDSGDAGTEQTMQENINQMKNKTREFTSGFSGTGGSERFRNLFALLLILIGMIFLLDNFNFIRFDIFWPLVLVIIGLMLIFRK